MMAHMVSPEKLPEQARLMESYGANCIYCTDSAGYMLPDEVTQKIGTLRAGLSAGTEVDFHDHHNMGMAIANSLAAIEAGAARIDGSVTEASIFTARENLEAALMDASPQPVRCCTGHGTEQLARCAPSQR